MALAPAFTVVSSPVHVNTPTLRGAVQQPPAEGVQGPVAGAGVTLAAAGLVAAAAVTRRARRAKGSMPKGPVMVGASVEAAESYYRDHLVACRAQLNGVDAPTPEETDKHMEGIQAFAKQALAGASAAMLFTSSMEAAVAYPIFAQQNYANPREYTGKIVCANCHLASKPIEVRLPQAVLPDTIFKMEVEVPAKYAKRRIASIESGRTLEHLLHTIRKAIWFSSFLVVAFTALCVCIIFGPEEEFAWQVFLCVIFGLICGNLIGYFTEYATSYTYWPTQSIAEKSDTGPATVMIQGLGVGMISTVPPVIFIFATILGSYYMTKPHGVYGVAVSAVGMLSTLGVTLATDAFGPVADNAGGIAEMAPDAEISEEVRETTDSLDALGNTTAATGKGFAIGSAVLTSLALMNAFAEEAGIKLTGVQVLDPVVLPGVLLGAMLPFLFAALTMLSVGRAAESIMWECRDQMNKKYLEGVPLAPAKCVEISTVSSLKEMVAPGVLAVFTPAIVGAALGAPGLLGLLTGAISSGFLLAVMMANAGGAWDNAKKYVEKGNLGEGRGKHSENHTAVIVGDTVGDPFKDTSGPALNILIKLMSVISLVLAPKLQKEPWEEGWYYSLVIMFVLAVGGYLFQKYGQGLELHNKEEILAATKRRKEGGAPAAAAAPEADVEEAREDGADAAAEEEPDLNAPVKLMQEARKADNKDGADAAEESQE